MPSGILYLNLFNQVAKIGCGQMSYIAEYDMADQLTICHVSYPAQFSSDVDTLEDFSIAFLSLCSIASDLPQFASGPPQEGGRNRQNDSEDSSYGLAVLVEKISEPEHARNKRAFENAAIFSGIIIGSADRLFVGRSSLVK
jgi:hypothetical protein